MYRKKATILDLPTELLVKIFSYLPAEEVVTSTRYICKRFEAIIFLPHCAWWKSISVDDNISTGELMEWIQSSPSLVDFKAKDRDDIDIIGRTITTFSRKVESITFENCCSKENVPYCRSAMLSLLVKRCPRLHNCNFNNCKIYSPKFFKTITNTRKKNNSITKKKWKYAGPISKTQLHAILQGINNFDVDSVEFQCKGKIISLNAIMDLLNIKEFDPTALNYIWRIINRICAN